MNRSEFLVFLLTTVLFLLAGCASNQHLVFFTNSSIGIDISSEPQTATPFKFVVGYKRQEGVIDPIGTGYDLHASHDTSLPVVPPDINAPVLPTKVGYFVQRGTAAEPHSVLAKMNFGAAGGGAEAAAAQWFATGEAAKILAGQPGIAGAIAGDPEVNESIRTVRLDPEMMAQYASLSSVYRNIKKHITNNGKEQARAREIIAEVDKLDTGEFRVPFRRYSFTSALHLKWEEQGLPSPEEQFPPTFSNVTSYISNMKKSYDVAVEAAKDKDIKKADGKSLSDQERADLIEAVSTYATRIKDLEVRISENQDVIAMVEFYFHNMLLSKKQ